MPLLEFQQRVYHCFGLPITKFCKKMGNGDAAAFLDRLNKTLALAERNTFGNTLGDVDAEELIHTLPDTLPQADPE